MEPPILDPGPMVPGRGLGYRDVPVELRHLTCFVAVSDQQSFSKAAKRLHVVPSNVSQQIQQLERELGVKLFERTTRAVELTDAGRVLYRSAVRVLEGVDELRALAREQAAASQATIRGCFAPGTGDMVSALVGELATSHPGLRLLFEPLQSADVVARVTSGAYAVGICQLASSPARSLLLARHPQSSLAMPEDHPLAGKPVIVAADLDGQDLIVIDRRTHAEFHGLFLALFEEMGIEPRVRPFPLTNPEQVMELVAARQGLALIDRRTMVHYPAAGTVVRPLEGCPLQAEYYLVWGVDDDPRVGAVVEVARRMVPQFMAL